MTCTEFWVGGCPESQGSKTAVARGGRVRLIEGTGSKQRRLNGWRDEVTRCARAAHQGRPPLDEPVTVDVRFYLPMPASRPAAVRRIGLAVRSTKPDVDKLARAVLDAMTAAGVWTDDSRVTRLTVAKLETTGTPGAQITYRGAT